MYPLVWPRAPAVVRHTPWPVRGAGRKGGRRRGGAARPDLSILEAGKVAPSAPGPALFPLLYTVTSYICVVLYSFQMAFTCQVLPSNHYNLRDRCYYSSSGRSEAQIGYAQATQLSVVALGLELRCPGCKPRSLNSSQEGNQACCMILVPRAHPAIHETQKDFFGLSHCSNCPPETQVNSAITHLQVKKR